MQEVSIAVRAYIPSAKRKNGQTFESEPANEDLVLIFDTETTTDIYQNLKVGLAQLYYKHKLVEKYAFYWHVTKAEQTQIESYYSSLGFKVYHRDDFNEKVFLPLTYITKAKVVGFNLPFDISRLALSWGQSHNSGGRAFTFYLSKNRHLPAIKVEHIDSKMSFIGFIRPWSTFAQKRKGFFSGSFLDLRTAVFALTNEKLDLKTAGETLGASVTKRPSEEHGRINEEYLGYLLRDVRSTWALYVACEKRFAMYGIDRALNRIYSPAGIGKAYLEKMGVHEFSEKNAWSPELVGKVMSTFYGARVEARIRKQPVEVTYVDFTSLYPTLYILLGADSYIKAKSIITKATTAETQSLLDTINLRNLREKATWSKLWTICKIKPNGDFLPIRARFGEENTRNIGLCEVTSDVSLWYALPDLIASKLHSGKAPIIEEAISFIASEPEEELQTIDVLPDVTVAPNQDFIKTLIQSRQKIKGHMKKTDNSAKKAELDIKQYVLKIIANSTSYGIYVQTNTKDLGEPESVSVYSLFGFKADSKVTENEGELFNPIVGSMITSSAKLFLAIAEKIVSMMKGYIAYLDTDGLFAEPRCIKPLQEYFARLNPYGFKEDLLKIEEDKATGKPLEKVTMYAISSKRYVLYHHNAEAKTFEIFKFSAHGLGHILFDEPDARKHWWIEILNIVYYGKHTDKYNRKLALMKYSISSWPIYKQVIKLNECNNKNRLDKQLKPFNFLLVGQGSTLDAETNEPVTPMIPFTKNLRSVLDIPFVDKTTGRVYTENMARYYQTLADVFAKYVNHPESKFDGETGVLARRKVHVSKNGIRHIGKESFHLDDSDVFGTRIDDTIEYLPVEERVKDMTLSEAESLGISHSQYFRYKNKIAIGLTIKPNRKTRRALLK